jgi:hypothetical protein
MSKPDSEQSQRFREAVERKEHDAQQRAEAEQHSLVADDRTQDTQDPRAKSTGHKKKTADKWNQ